MSEDEFYNTHPQDITPDMLISHLSNLIKKSGYKLNGMVVCFKWDGDLADDEIAPEPDYIFSGRITKLEMLGLLEYCKLDVFKIDMEDKDNE